MVRIRLIRPSIAAPQRLAQTLEKLGTTFVKLGQALSVHSELLPEAYVHALQQLQDHVGPFPSNVAKAEIETSLKASADEVFREIESEPLAAGSVAQVHRAMLRDGTRVVVKVRRPDIRRQLEEDVLILRWFLKSGMLVMPRLRHFRPLELVAELSRNLHKEIDFRQEASNIERFMEIFHNSPVIYIPRVMKELTTDSVIVQELSAGKRIDDPAFLPDGPGLAGDLVDAFIHQFFVVGVFHGDPHPGNIFVLPDRKICLHDFGLIGFLDQATRARLVAFLQAFVHQDGDWLLDAAIDLGLLGGSLDRSILRQELEELIQDFARMPLKAWSLGEAFIRIARMGSGRSVRIPHHLLVLLRAIFHLESLVRTLDPEFNLINGLFVKAGKAVKAVSGEDAGTLSARLKYETLLSLREFPEGLAKVAHRIRAEGLAVSFHHNGLNEMQHEIKQSSTRIALALIVLGLYIAASLLMQHSIGPRLAGMPVFAAIGYVLALWLTLKVVRGT